MSYSKARQGGVRAAAAGQGDSKARHCSDLPAGAVTPLAGSDLLRKVLEPCITGFNAE